MKNLIMGMAKSYDWSVLEPFVTSAKKNCPNAELVLFVDDISDFTRSRLIKWKVAYIDIMPDEFKSSVPNNSRWKIFSDFLEVYGTNYVQVFITDIRDVIFQADIFEAFKNHTNYLGYATEVDDIRGSKTGDRVNYDWLTDCFDKETADKFLDKKIICDGTTIGTVKEIETFAKKMWETVFAVESRVDFRIHDQAIANYLFYENLLPIENMIEIDVDSEIFTMALADNFSVQGDKIRRGDGGIPAVVHQYDRHEELIQFVDSVYRDKNFQVDKRFMDIRSVLEQVSCLLYANKIGESVQFCMKNFSAELNRGENVNSLLRIWEFVLQKPLTPAIGFIELTIQAALKFAPNFSFKQLNKICSLLVYSIQNNRGVESEFKIFILTFLLNVVNNLSNEGNIKLYSRFMNVIKLLNI